MFYHNYHIVNLRPWPFYGSISALFLVFGLLGWFYLLSFFFFFSIFSLMLVGFQWWRDVIREAGIEGWHSYYVLLGLRGGILLFIVSEVFFFVSFFWSYFHCGVSPCIELGQWWPPLGALSFNPLNVPLLNTLILVSSGVSVTWRHHRILLGNYGARKISLLLTIFLGVYFTILQGFEYVESYFTLRDSSYGSAFFVATGFHGLHVLLGTSFLLVCYFRLVAMHFRGEHLLGFEAASWYWHFVDVVWLFLYISIYWWGWFIFIILYI